jgi:hypothetical protein
VRFAGKSGFDQVFGVVNPESQKWLERVFKAINRPNKQSIRILIVLWNDTMKRSKN